MKFAKLVLEKYGLYDNRTLDFRTDAHLHVILGRNEAGKTSALSAIGDLLFGFNKSKKEYDFRFDAAALRLGATLVLRDGGSVSFRRRRGNKNIIVDDSDEPLGDSLLDTIVGTVDRAMFEREFGLTAERLRKGGEELLAAHGDMAETLAAGSAGLSSLNGLKARLQSEADELFTRQGRNKKFNTSHASYDQAKRDLREAIVTTEAVQQAQSDLAESAAHQKRLESEREQAARELSRLLRSRDTAAKLRELDRFERDLSALPAPPDAAAGKLPQWRDALKAEAGNRQAIIDNKTALAENAAAIADLHEQPDILANALEIAGLQRAAGAAEDYRKDLPRREREHHAALSELESAASALGLASSDALIAAIPTDGALAEVSETVQQRHKSASKAADLQERLAKAKSRREELERQLERQGHVADPADFKRVFTSFRDAPDDAAALQRLTVSIRQDLRDIENRLARLSPPPPPLRDLIALPLPDAAKIDSIRQKEQRISDELTRLDQDLDEKTSALDATERSLRLLEQARTLVTRDDLAAARKARDEAIDALWTAEAGARDAALSALAKTNAALDRITDDLLANADEAARKLALEQERQRLNDSLNQLRETLRLRIEEKTQLAQTWRNLWAGLDIEPDTPATMARWLNEVGHAIADYDALSADKKEMEALRERLQAQEQPLKAFLARLGVAPLEEASVKHLYDVAEAALGDLESRWTERRVQAQDLQNAVREIEAFESEIETFGATQEAQAGEWRAALAILQCKPDASLAIAERALREWGKAIDAHRKFAEEDRRLSGVRTRLAEFETKVRELCARLAPDLADGDAFDAVEQLNARLQAARDAARELQRLRNEAARLHQQIGQREKDHADAQAAIATAAATLALDDAAGLEAALDRMAQREELLAAEAAARRDLAAMTNGLSAEALRAEREGVDFDTLDGKIGILQDRLEQIREEEKTAFAAARDAKGVLADLLKGRNAAVIAQRKQEAATELVDISRNWLLRAAAARLAGQAIERYRQSAQTPVMARASALFAHATGGDFGGLDMRFGDNDEPVFRAIRASGEDVAVDGLSDGTRDQLFLALRLALLEQRRGEPLPFIGDDLLTSFDEERTGQALEMLAESGAARQTILFTHHRHVAEIARERLGDRLDLIEL